MPTQLMARQARSRAWLTGCATDGSFLRRYSDFNGVVVGSDDAAQREALAPTSGTSECAGTLDPERSDARLGEVSIEYQGGSGKERFARVVDDPVDPGNKVLMFWLQDPNVRDGRGTPSKGRVQMDVYDNVKLREVRMSVRLLVPNELSVLGDYPGNINWFTVSEWWNDPDWIKSTHPFRISVNIVREGFGANAQLRFAVHGQTKLDGEPSWSKTVWEEQANGFEIPLGRWMTLDYYWKEGDASTGRFRLTVSYGKRTVQLFDVTNFTHHPDDRAPKGLSHFNPLKLYTSKELVEYVRSRGQAIKIYWDDMDLRWCPAGAAPSGCLKP
ncbi:hypothetical protein [Aquincola tertiaricarbonis]|uniref:hypothetical protein n=1 Tax=Aquincola tertiaricarbonis TaxID=391953 RepID=UPI0012EDC35F|nr:hypothetical protein [Aquincola tertiaricarbonis]